MSLRRQSQEVIKGSRLGHIMFPGFLPERQWSIDQKRGTVVDVGQTPRRGGTLTGTVYTILNITSPYWKSDCLFSGFKLRWRRLLIYWNPFR